MKIFDLRNDDQFIELYRRAEELIPASFNNLVTEMKAQRGQSIFFIFDLNYPYIRLELIKAGFVEYVDFANGLSFLTREQGGEPRPEYKFIKAL